EIGHTVVKDGGRLCGCGKKGHLESYAGRRSIELTARRRSKRGSRTDLFDIMRERGRDRVTSGVIARALDRGDRLTVGLIDDAVWALGIALSNAQNLLDLEAIIVGGGLGDRLGRPFVDRVAGAMQPLLFVPDRPPTMLTTELQDLSGAVGAAALAGGRAAGQVVYSTTVEAVSSARTRIERAFDPESIPQMKAEAERELTVGGTGLAGQAIRAGLVDEVHLFVAPIVVGGGNQCLPDDVSV